VAKILIVDDERNILELVKLYLNAEGHSVVTAADGLSALEKFRSEQPDLLVLDIMLPGIDGWEVCRRLRQNSQIPIIMLTARGEAVDRIVGLELGADDYVVKPFNPRELVARIKAVLRRTSITQAMPTKIAVGDLQIDPERREVTIKDRPVTLRAKEFDLLTHFAQHVGLVLSREQLLESVWGYEYYGDTRTVDVHVAHLRDKLSQSDVEIETVWGVGYKLVSRV